METEQALLKAEAVDQEDPKLIIARPLGPQGPKIGLQITGEDDLRRLDGELGKLSPKERHTASGIKRAANLAEISIVDF